ncbi:hypothetical protein GCM10007884_26630 [Methylobacterium brachythecii]|uniref:Uncharacterized protein n=1 Tax=Methylobacterium brachythecii TaxID=1176177 RepID=A0ABQ6D3P8_9HYPH|nr:hypothetical protein GCM10007884_26630 [Methylobacterium brachythecii]
MDARLALALDQVEIGTARVARARDDTLGDGCDLGMKVGHAIQALLEEPARAADHAREAMAGLLRRNAAPNMERIQSGGHPRQCRLSLVPDAAPVSPWASAGSTT